MENLHLQSGKALLLPPSTPSLALVVTPTSQFDPKIGEMLHFVDDDNSNSVSTPSLNLSMLKVISLLIFIFYFSIFSFP